VRLNVEDDPATAPKPKYEKIQKRVVEIWKGNELEASLDVTDQFYADDFPMFPVCATIQDSNRHKNRIGREPAPSDGRNITGVQTNPESNSNGPARFLIDVEMFTFLVAQRSHPHQRDRSQPKHLASATATPCSAILQLMAPRVRSNARQNSRALLRYLSVNRRLHS